MSGLLTKEFLYIKKQGKTLLLLLAFYVVFFGIMEKNSSSTDILSGIVIPITVMLTVVLTINTFAYDEAAKWDGYARSLPVSCAGIVGAKYLFCIIFSALGTVITIVVNLIAGHGQIKPEDLAAACAGAGAIPLVLCSILLPIFYKFGLQKARIALMVVFVVPMLFLPMIKNSGFVMSNAQVMLLLKLSPVIVLAVVAVSYFLSCKIYEYKEI